MYEHSQRKIIYKFKKSTLFGHAFFVLFLTMISSCTLQSAYQGIRWWFSNGGQYINTFSRKVSFPSGPFTDSRTPSRVQNCLSCVTLKNDQITFFETQEWWALSWKQTNKLLCIKVAMSYYLNWFCIDLCKVVTSKLFRRLCRNCCSDSMKLDDTSKKSFARKAK